MNAADAQAGRAVLSFYSRLIFPSTAAKLNFPEDVHVQLAWSEPEA